MDGDTNDKSICHGNDCPCDVRFTTAQGGYVRTKLRIFNLTHKHMNEDTHDWHRDKYHYLGLS